MNVTFITGNQKKADYLANYLGFTVEHRKLDLEEIQSLDLRQIVEHKVKQAYEHVESPVVVEDVALEFNALGRLPGPFIKWFLDELSLSGVCTLLDGKVRTATARCVFGYYDGKDLRMFEGSLQGLIAETPARDNGFGWDSIFIPDGYKVARSELSEEDDIKTYLQLKPFAELRNFLESLS